MYKTVSCKNAIILTYRFRLLTADFVVVVVNIDVGYEGCSGLFCQIYRSFPVHFSMFNCFTLYFVLCVTIFIVNNKFLFLQRVQLVARSHVVS